LLSTYSQPAEGTTLLVAYDRIKPGLSRWLPFALPIRPQGAYNFALVISRIYCRRVTWCNEELLEIFCICHWSSIP